MKKVEFEIRSIKLDKFLELRYDLGIPGMSEQINESFVADRRDFITFLNRNSEATIKVPELFNWDGSGIEPSLMHELRTYLFEKLYLKYVNKSIAQEEFISELKGAMASLIVGQEADDILSELKPMQRAVGKREEKVDDHQPVRKSSSN